MTYNTPKMGEFEDEDAQLAADMQLAYDIQAAEEAHQQQQQQSSGSHAPSLTSRTTPRSLHSFPGAETTYYRNGEIPVVQGRSVPFPLSIPLPFDSSARSGSSGARSAINSDGFAMQQQNMSLIHVPAEINERMVEMMVDTGAQSSVISAQLMRTLGLQSKLDKRMQGMAQGVGRARILGLIENCPVQIGHVEFLLYFLVLDVPDDMIILGIDQMRRFKCLIDLENDKLIFGGKDGVEVSFLPPEVHRNRPAMSGCPIS